MAQKLLIAVCGLLFAGIGGAQELALKEAQVRSLMGEPLNIRIPISAPVDANLDAGCFTFVKEPGKSNLPDQAGDAQISLVELRNSRYLQIRTRSVFNEPFANFAVNIECTGQPRAEKSISVLLDPPVAASPAAAQTTQAPPAATEGKDLASTGHWTVYAGDTLAKIAKGIYPKNRARQAQYIGVLRKLNPALLEIKDDEPLVPGQVYVLPDLKQLSFLKPSALKSALPDTKAESRARVAPDRKPLEQRPISSGRASKPPVAQTKPKTIEVAPTKIEKQSAPPAAVKAPQESAKKADIPTKIQTTSRVDGAGFQLKLSAPDIDLSRSRNITEVQRKQMREKLALLDADDQVSAMLSLRNTVLQLETRLNELQRKLAAPGGTAASVQTLPPVPPAPSAAAGAGTSTPSAAVTAAAPDSGNTPAKAETANEPGRPASTAPVSPDTGKPRVKPDAGKTIKTVETPSILDSVAESLPATEWLIGLGVGLLGLVGLWFWTHRDSNDSQSALNRALKRADDSKKDDLRSNDGASGPQTATSDKAEEDVEFAKWASESGWKSPMELSREQEAAAAMQEPDAIISAPVPEEHQTLYTDTPASVDETPARFELDSSPATSVDLLLNSDEAIGDDRVRRVQYMQERYPELKNNTVSIDDADSIINATRLYYDDGHSDKACELLTFAIEERPQQVRFWLAQFEIFRLDHMAPEFTALAKKFHVFFGQASAWPKVRQIGYELDPSEPLFAAAGRDALTGQVHFDPIAENWLNSPMDFTSEGLASDLRIALFDDFRVDRSDLEAITERLSGGHK